MFFFFGTKHIEELPLLIVYYSAGICNFFVVVDSGASMKFILK